MKNKLAFLILLFPAMLIAQTDGNTIKQSQQQEVPDFKKDGIFKAIFHLGLNAAQIDGDDFAGYNQFGLNAGAGVLVRFHKYFSASVGFDYSMEGARQELKPSKNPSDAQLYQVQWDYVQVPMLINVHDKNIIMFGIGPQLGFMVRYKEWNQQGDDITNNIPAGLYGPGNGQPRRVDLDAVADLHFLIKKKIGIGLKFQYSMLKIRSSDDPNNGFHGEYNNVLTFNVMYILDTVKKK